MAARLLSFVATLSAAIAFAAVQAAATTIVPMSDRDLAQSCRAIVTGTVLRAEAIESVERRAVFTYVTVDVERVLKGEIPVGQIVLRQLGGITAEKAFVVFAAPALTPGDRVLLFLNTDDDGSLHVAHMKLGAYHVEVDGPTGLEFVNRAVGSEYLRPTTGEEITWRAPVSEFLVTIERILGEASSDVADIRSDLPDIRLSPPEYAGLERAGGTEPAFTFLGDGFRWFEPDSDRTVRVKVNNKFAFTPSLGLDEVRCAFLAWSSVSGSSLKVEYGGSTDSGGLSNDGVTSITYGDPKRQIDDLVNCRGVIGLASVVGNPGETKVIGGRTFARLVESDLVLNNGIECLTSSNPLLLEEVLTHEFGHDLGLGHSSELYDEPNPQLRDATMYFVGHNDGRGALLRRDDSDAIRFLYKGPDRPFAFVTTALPDAVPGQFYDRQMNVRGGTSPYAISIVSGALPAGLTLAPSGRIYGTPTVSATGVVTIRVTDSDSAAFDRSLSIRVSASPSPFVEHVTFSGSMLRINGLYLSDGATVTVNGVATSRTPKYKPRKSAIVVKGSASSLNLRRDGTDVVIVTIGGLASNAFTF